MIFDYAQKPLCSRSGQSLWSIKLPLFLNVKTDLCNISDRTHLLPCSKICRIFSSFLCISTFWDSFFLPLHQIFKIPKSNIFQNFTYLIKVIINVMVIMQSFLFIIFNKLIISHICISVSLNPNFLSLQIFPQVQQVPLKCFYHASQFKSKVAGKAPQYDLSKRLILTLSWNLAATVSRCTINLLRRWWTLLIPPISNWVPECGAASYSKPLINWRLILPIKSGIL